MKSFRSDKRTNQAIEIQELSETVTYQILTLCLASVRLDLMRPFCQQTFVCESFVLIQITSVSARPALPGVVYSLLKQHQH